jgi:hypothetical protein
MQLHLTGVKDFYKRNCRSFLTSYNSMEATLPVSRLDPVPYLSVLWKVVEILIQINRSTAYYPHLDSLRSSFECVRFDTRISEPAWQAVLYGLKRFSAICGSWGWGTHVGQE